MILDGEGVLFTKLEFSSYFTTTLSSEGRGKGLSRTYSPLPPPRVKKVKAPYAEEFIHWITKRSSYSALRMFRSISLVGIFFLLEISIYRSDVEALITKDNCFYKFTSKESFKDGICVFCRAAELMVKSGADVTLRIAKQGAIYHGLATLLSQPTPMVSRGMFRGLETGFAVGQLVT